MSTANSNSNVSPARVLNSPPPYTIKALSHASSSIASSPVKAASSTKRPRFTHGDLVVIFTAMSCVLMFFTRYNLSVAIVAMVPQIPKTEFINQTHALNHSEETLSFVKMSAATDSNQIVLEFNEEKILNKSIAIEKPGRLPLDERLDWDTDTQSYVLSAYFYGYTLMQIPAGTLCDMIGFRRPLGISIVMTCLLTLLSPIASSISPFAMQIVRIMLGMFHTCILSCGYKAIHLWLPSDRQSPALAWLSIGIEVGGLTTLLFTGYLCANPFFGWRASFYLGSIFPFLWIIPYYCLIYESPKQHPSLSAYERKLLQSSRQQGVIYTNHESFCEPHHPVSTISGNTVNGNPNSSLNTHRSLVKSLSTVTTLSHTTQSKWDLWRRILVCGPFWASCIAKLTTSFGYYVITTKMPAYLNDTLHVPLAQNGFFCGLSYFGILISKLICVYQERRKPPMSYAALTRRRKMYQTVSFVIPAMAMFILYLLPPSFEMAVGMLVLAMFGMGFQVGGEFPNLAEYAGKNSAMVFSVANTFACLDGMLAPLVTAKVLETVPTPETAWGYMFLLCSILYILGAIFFCVFADSTPQNWSESDKIQTSFTLRNAVVISGVQGTTDSIMARTALKCVNLDSN